MKYIDLHNIALQEGQLKQNINLLKNNYSIKAPNSVIEQFYIDHNDDGVFKELYGDLDILKMNWSLIEVGTEKFLQINKAASYPNFLKETSQDASRFKEEGEYAIARIERDVAYWKKNGTWSVPPIFIDGHILKNPTTEFHLVEGHTRVGSLIGNTKQKLVRVASKHKVYFGNYT